MTPPILAGLPPVHPGALLREDILPAIGLSKAELARRLGISRQSLYDVLGEAQAVTPDMALRFGRLFGNSPEMWLNMQAAYDLRVRGDELAAALAAIDPIAA